MTAPAVESLVVAGDNLPVLRALLPTHRGTVKVVYLDPPYNTGNAHAYRDRFGASGRAAGAPSHAEWLAFMRPRLELAREFLREDGVLFLHIDDRESAYAQILAHEVFGEHNGLGTLIHQRAKGGGNARMFVRGHDYIHIWGKDAERVAPFVTEKKPPARYETVAGRRVLVEDDFLRVSFGRYRRGEERRLMYEDVEAVRGAAKRAEVDARLEAGDYMLRPWGEPDPATGLRKHAVLRLTPAEEATSKLYSIIRVMNADGSADLDRLGLGGVFGYPKPVELLRILIESQTWSDPDALVLDFFAGSGTTAEAVMRANLRDDGRRRFLLIQIAEPLRTDYPSTGGRTMAPAAGEDTVPAARQAPGPVGGPAAEATGTSAAGPTGASATETDSTGFATIAEFCAERVRRAAAAHEASGGAPVPVRFLGHDEL
ncbi:MAG TPA: site-specific DNA-methyltransferase [Brevibacterium sp.]|nr:site-specific DNA-methyltransferase [Brevibacterium sp.]